MSKSKKNPILLIVIIFVIIAIGVGVYFLVTSKEKYTDSTGQYEICPGNDGKNNNSNITTAKECEQAAKKGGGSWIGEEDEPDFPKGCYEYTTQEGSSLIYFNKSDGTSEDSSQSICKKQPSEKPPSEKPQEVIKRKTAVINWHDGNTFGLK